MIGATSGSIMLQGGKIIVEDKRIGVIGVVHATHAGIARTEITGRVILNACFGRGCFDLALPRTFGAVW